MNTLNNFLNMGGYAFYVWWSYGVVAVVLIANLVVALRVRKRVLRELKDGRTNLTREKHPVQGDAR